MTSKMDMVSKNGWTVKFTKANTEMVQKWVRAFLNSWTKAIIKASSSTTKSKAKVQFDLLRKICLVLKQKLRR